MIEGRGEPRASHISVTDSLRLTAVDTGVTFTEGVSGGWYVEVCMCVWCACVMCACVSVRGGMCECAEVCMCVCRGVSVWR